MNKKHYISITNVTGGRNRGVEALVYSTMFGIEELIGTNSINWHLHTNDPLYDDWRYSDKHVTTHFSYLTNTSEHFKSKLINKAFYQALSLGERFIPKRYDLAKSQTALKASDLVICSGGDIFTSDYNNLRKHLSYPLVSKKSYLCSHTIGPFKKEDEIYFKKCIDNISAISVREKISYEYVKNLVGNETRVECVADVAFSLPSNEILGKKILQHHLVLEDEKFVAVSVSKGVIRYSGLDESSYIKEFSKFLDYLTNEGYIVILIPHVCERNPNNNDLMICRTVLDSMKHPKKARIMAYEYSAVEFKSVIRHASALIGARTHATIASMSQLVPTVSIAYSRKAYGIVEEVYGDSFQDVIVDAQDVSCSRLITSFNKALSINIESNRVANLKQLSKKNFSIAKDLLTSE